MRAYGFWKVFIVFLLVLMSACSKQEDDVRSFNDSARVKRVVKFDLKQYRPYMKKGKAKITGRFCIPLKNGRTECLSGQAVLLNPVTDYSTEWFERYWKNGELLESPHDEAARRSKLVQTNKKGDFAFSSLPVGEYYVGAVACPYAGSQDQFFNYQRWAAKVKITEKEKTVKVVLEKVFEHDY